MQSSLRKGNVEKKFAGFLFQWMTETEFNEQCLQIILYYSQDTHGSLPIVQKTFNTKSRQIVFFVFFSSSIGHTESTNSLKAFALSLLFVLTNLSLSFTRTRVHSSLWIQISNSCYACVYVSRTTRIQRYIQRYVCVPYTYTHTYKMN